MSELIEKPVIDNKTQVMVTLPADELSIKKQSVILGVLKSESIKREQKKKELIDEGNINELDLGVILGAEDKDFYYSKKALYLETYPELNDPFDQDDLHHMIMEQIFQRKLLKKLRKNPNASIEDSYNASTKRESDFKKNLSVRRADRLKGKEKKQVVNIAELSVNFNGDDKMKEMHKRVIEARRDEQELRILGDEKIMD